MATILRIDGVDRTAYLHDGSLSIEAQIGGRTVARFATVDPFDEAYRPAIRQKVYVVRDELTALGSMTGGALTDTTLVVPSAAFTSADIGKIVEVPGAGPFGTVLHAVIATINSGTSVELNRHAYATASGVSVRWGWRHFAGIISAVGEEAMVDGLGLISPVSAVDFTQICDRRLVSETYPAGFTHDNLMNDIGVKYLDGQGLYVDEEIEPNDPLPELIFDLVPVSQVCDRVTELIPGLVWFVDECPLLYMREAAATPTPVALNTGNATVHLGTTSEVTIDTYRNRQYLRYGSGTREVTVTLTGNGSQREWVLDYVPQSKPAQVYDPNVIPDPIWKNVGVAGVDTLFEWVYDGATRTMEQLTEAPPGTPIPALGAGQSVTVTFVAVFPQTVMEKDDGEIATHGDWDAVDVRADVFDPTTAQQVCAALLRKGLSTPRRYDVTTFEHRFRPGQRGVLTSGLPQASGNHLVENVRAELLPIGVGYQTWLYHLDMLEGDEPQSTWVDWWRGGRGGGSSGASGSITVGTPPTPPTGGGTQGVWIAFLGGADSEWRGTRPTSGVWFDAPHAVDLILNGDLAGAVAAVRVHLIVSDAAMTITPRLYNTSSSVVAGTGVACNDTSYTSSSSYQAFYFNILPGVQVYRLQFNVSSTLYEYGYWQAKADNQG